MGRPQSRLDHPEIIAPPHHVSGPTIQSLIAIKNGSNLINFHFLQERVNGFRNMVSVAARRLDKGVVGRVDGLAAISAGSSRNHVPRPPFPRTHHPDANHG